jgi:hypothetical protein
MASNIAAFRPVPRCLRLRWLPPGQQARVPHLVRYACNIGLPADYQGWAPDEAPAWDGITQAWYDTTDLAAVTAALRSPPGHIQASERSFMGTFQHMITDQVVHVDRSRKNRGITMFFMLHRRPELTRAQAVSYWRTHHVPLVCSTQGEALVRYTTNVGLPADLHGWSVAEAPPYDGIAVLAVDHDIAGQKAFIAAHADILIPDERMFMGTYRAVFTREILTFGDNDRPLPSRAADG